MLISSPKIKGKFVCIALTLFLVLFSLYSKSTIERHLEFVDKRQYLSTNFTGQHSSLPLWERTLDFEKLNYSNETGHPNGDFIVPNYIHYVSFGGEPINYLRMVCILAAFKNQKPEKIFFHYDKEKTFSGQYWAVLKETPGFNDILVFKNLEAPSEIFGQRLSPDWKAWHGSDIVRIKVLMKYGGIYLDADCYLVKSIDRFRKFEMTLNWDQDQFLGSQVLIGHKNARFLQKYLDTYKVYDENQWYYNAGEKPTVEILYNHPELIHRVKVVFGADTKYGYKVFQLQWNGWRDMYVVHTLANHQYLYKNLSEKAVFPVEFTEKNVGYYNIAFRDMAYEVYDIANIKWPKNRYEIEAWRSSTERSEEQDGN